MASLLGKADTTLVKAATDAAMANVPVDISRVHERISKAHAKMTASVGKSWGVALKAIGEIGAALVQKGQATKDDTIVPYENFNTNGKVEAKVDTTPTTIENDEGELVEQDDPSWNEPGYDPGIHGTIEERKQAELKSYQTLTEFNHKDMTIKVSNTDQYVETLREEIYGLSDIRKTALNDIEEQGKLDGKTREEIKVLKQEEKVKQKKKKRDLQRKKENVNNSNRKFAGYRELLTSQLAEGSINMEASGMYGANKIKFANALLGNGKPLADGSKAVQGYDNDGNLVFTYVDKNNRPIKSGGENLTVSGSDIENLLVQQSPKRPLVDGLIDLKNIRKNYEYGIGGFSTEIARTVDKEVKDKNTFLDLAFYQSKNTDSSLADTLHDVKYNKDNAPILDREDPTDLAGAFITGLADMGNPEDYSKENPHPYDQDQDGDFDKDDYMTEKNYMAIVKKALSGDDLNFSKFLLKKHLELQTAGLLDEAFKKNNPVIVEEDENALD